MSHDKIEVIMDVTKVLAVNLTAITISIDNYNKVLTAISVTVALTYTIWKWQNDYKKSKK